MKVSTITFLTVMSINTLFAQIDPTLDRFEFSENVVNQPLIGKKAPGPEVEGSPYLTDEFVKAKVVTKDGMIEDKARIRINTYFHELEVKYPNRQVRVGSFVIDSVHTESGTSYITIENNYPQLNLFGFLQIDAHYGFATMYTRLHCYKKDPTYVEGVGVGSRNYELIQKKESYLGNGKDIIKITKNHKKNVNALAALGINYDKAGKARLISPEAVKSYLSTH